MWEKERIALDLISKSAEKFGAYNLSVKQALVLLYIADHGTVSKRDIEADLNLEISTSCHILQRLSNGRSGTLKDFTGLGLIEYYRDPNHKRRCLCCLSEKGKQLIQLLDKYRKTI